MVLSNITHHQKGSLKLIEPLSGVQVSKLVELFVFKERLEGSFRFSIFLIRLDDPGAWIGQVLMNVTQVRAILYNLIN